jgi:hypothetical protein
MVLDRLKIIADAEVAETRRETLRPRSASLSVLCASAFFFFLSEVVY